jgi:hypothetical protein
MKRILVAILMAQLGFSIQTMAQGDLMITPSRIVFEGNKQKEQLNLLNMGKDTTTYTISFVQRNMKEDGSFVTIEKPDSGQMFADPYLRIFPRQVTLAPREPQVILVQFRRKAEMAAGEYRSHLYFRSEQNYKPLGMGKSDSNKILVNVQLTPIFGVSIPIIIRTGEVNVNATLSNLELVPMQGTTQSLKLTINRSGNISTFGDITVQYIPDKGKTVLIATVAGVGVYTNIQKRNMMIKLNSSVNLKPGTGRLKVQYTGKVDNKSIVYGESELVLK